MSSFKNLDPLLHSQLRLAIMSLLMNVEEADFNFLKDETGATSGNLSVQINKLKEAGYIKVSKRFYKNYPQTMCRVTPLGRSKFEDYVNDLQAYLKS